jgi:tRNA(Arg) A34 adenosine deaminase TadA
MQRAVELAQHAVQANRGGPFGAVVVLDGRIVGEGANDVLGSNDPTAHAEIVAIRQACARLATFRLQGAELYATSEPCPMCLAAICWARVDRIYFANTKEAATAIGFDDSLFYSQLALPVERRDLPMQRIASPNAALLFEAWANKLDRTRY